MTKGRQVLFRDSSLHKVARHMEQWNELGSILMDLANRTQRDGGDAQPF